MAVNSRNFVDTNNTSSLMCILLTNICFFFHKKRLWFRKTGQPPYSPHGSVHGFIGFEHLIDSSNLRHQRKKYLFFSCDISMKEVYFVHEVGVTLSRNSTSVFSISIAGTPSRYPYPVENERGLSLRSKVSMHVCGSDVCMLLRGTQQGNPDARCMPPFVISLTLSSFSARCSLGP